MAIIWWCVQKYSELSRRHKLDCYHVECPSKPLWPWNIWSQRVSQYEPSIQAEQTRCLFSKNKTVKRTYKETRTGTRTRYVKLKRLQIFCSVINNNKKKKEILRFLRWLAPKHSPTHSIKRNPKGVHHILTTLRRRKTRRKFCKHFESATPSNKHLCLASKASHSLYL